MMFEVNTRYTRKRRKKFWWALKQLVLYKIKTNEEISLAKGKIIAAQDEKNIQWL